MNAYADKLLGRPLETLFGRPVWEAIKGEDFLRHLEASLSEERAEPVDLELYDFGREEVRTIQTGTTLVKHHGGNRHPTGRDQGA